MDTLTSHEMNPTLPQAHVSSLVQSKSIDLDSKPTLEDDDEFQDAWDDADDSTIPKMGDMDLERSLTEAKLAVDYFFNNKFAEAKQLMKPWSQTSMYHSIGNCVFLFLEAVLTFEHEHIVRASEAISQCLAVCNRHRKKNTISESIGKTFKRHNYEQYTEIEAHAELCSAEALLLKALLTFIEDETLTSLIKGGIKIRSCFNSYKQCGHILEKRNWQNTGSKVHFESGVRMGVGTFNLMVSLLPARVIRLLEFIGFSGNKQTGLQDLKLGQQMDGIRQVLCVMTLLAYNLIVCYVLSHQEGDIDFCDEVLTAQLKAYPKGVWFLFFKGRLEFMKGNLDDALTWYKQSWKSQDLWPQFHHLCFWEILWVNCAKLDWKEAEMFASLLCEHSKWSRTIYTYQRAAVMLMRDKKDLTPSELQTIENLMREVPQYKQRIAGKSLPMEKFTIKKAERFFSEQKNLVLPAIELMYLWNVFKVLGKHFHLADNVYKLIEKAQQALDARTERSKYDVENRALILLLKGACLRQMKSPLQSLQCLEGVLSLHKEIKEDEYLVPYAIVEIALLYIDEGRIDNAIAALEDAKKNYTGYSLESRLHFRIHNALSELKPKNRSKNNSTPDHE